MRIIFPEKECDRFEGTGLNGLCPKESFTFDKEQGFRGREGINLLVHARHSISLFSFVIFNSSFLFFFFLLFSVLASVL